MTARTSALAAHGAPTVPMLRVHCWTHAYAPPLTSRYEAACRRGEPLQPFCGIRLIPAAASGER